MSGAQIIAAYERVLEIMKLMHDAAGKGEWDELVVLEQQCKSVVHGLMARESGERLDTALEQRKLALIRQVLALDAAIRSITEPWLQQLQAFLGARERKRRLFDAYGAPDGA